MDFTAEICMENLDALIEAYLPYIVRTVSSITGRYVSLEHDEEFTVALSAFTEAVQRFDSNRGRFLNYAALVMRSRLKTYMQETRKHADTVSLDGLLEQGVDPAAPQESETDLREEIQQYQEELRKFDLTLDIMVEKSPCHRDTRETAIRVAEQAGQNEKIVSETYRKRKLPIRPVAALCCVTEKIVKTSKQFILGTMLVFVLKLPGLSSWIREAR